MLPMLDVTGNASSVLPSSNLLLEAASKELESIRSDSSEHGLHPFPPACLDLIKSLPGNHKCIDCGASDPEWASVSYGAMMCLHCSGEHRSLGVRTSCVRSIAMDHWSHTQILAMLEGGNAQLHDFFERHALSSTTFDAIGTSLKTRYKTKAARFYREHMGRHVSEVLGSGFYQGREASRKIKRSPSQNCCEVTTHS